MDIEYDPGKDALNQAKHGISLAEAVGLAPKALRLYCVVYTMRVDAIRIISLRKANAREVRLYVAEDEKG